MNFLDIIYSCLLPVLLLMVLLASKPYQPFAKSILAAANTTLIVFFFIRCYQLYNLYKIITMFGVDISLKGLLRLLSTNIGETVRNVLMLLIPLLFLFKKLSSNVLLSMVMLIVLRWDYWVYWLSKFSRDYVSSSWSYYFDTASLVFAILNYCSLLIGSYALLWLLKRLPHQHQ